MDEYRYVSIDPHFAHRIKYSQEVFLVMKRKMVVPVVLSAEDQQCFVCKHSFAKTPVLQETSE